KAIKLSFSADVDAPRGIIEQQHLRPRLKPAADDALLLVAAAQAGDRCSQTGRLDGQLLGRFGRRPPLASATDESGRAALAERADRNVLADIHGGEESESFAVLGHEANSG